MTLGLKDRPYQELDVLDGRLRVDAMAQIENVATAATLADHLGNLLGQALGWSQQQGRVQIALDGERAGAARL